MNDLIKNYFLQDEAQQKCISAAIGRSHAYCMRASQLMKVAYDVNTRAAIITSIDFSDSSRSYVTLLIRFQYLNLDMKYFTIFSAFDIDNSAMENDRYVVAEHVCAHAALDLTHKDFDQFESIIKPIFADFDQMRGIYLKSGKPLDVAFTTAKNFLEKKEPTEKMNYVQEVYAKTSCKNSL